MATYVLPQVLVFQEFEAQPVALDQPLRACIVGPQFKLHRYTDDDEKDGIQVGSYDYQNDQCYGWPGREAGGIVDFDYTKIFIDEALLKFFHDASGDSNTIVHVGPGKNRIRATNTIWQTANGFARSVALLRDVKIGDVIKLIASACGNPVVYTSYVAGLIADEIASIIEDADSDISNQVGSSAATSSSQGVGPFNNVGVDSIDGTLYDGLVDGNPSETYTVEVIGASVGGDATSALLKVTSASGKDNQAAITPAAFGSPTTVGTRGLTVTFENGLTGASSSTPGVDGDDFLIGQKWTVNVSQLFIPPLPVSGGTYVGGVDTTYVVEVTRGGQFSSATKPQISVSTTTGVDLSGPTDVVAAATAVPAGTQGVTISFTGSALNKGDRYTVVVESVKPGAVRTLVLANNLPEALRGECTSGSSSSAVPAPDLDVTLFIKKNIEVPMNRTGFAPLVNWEQSDTEICLKTGIQGFDADWAISGVLQPLPVEGGRVYVHYRDYRSENLDTVGTISTVSGVVEALGVVHPDNPLAFGVFKALENANGVEVKYLAVAPDEGALELEDWLAGLDVLVGRDDVYSLVPLTQSKDVLDSFLAHCESESSPENARWRICWLNRAAEQVKAIYTATTAGAALLATITDDPDTSGTQYTLVEIAGAEFLTKGVKPRDTVRAQYVSDGFGSLTYSEYVVDEVINEETIRLKSGPGVPVNVPSKIEIHRTLSKTQLATELATYPGLFRSRRAALVWPDQVGNAGLTFPGYFLCSGLAGLRSGVLPHQGLTNVELQGFDDVARTTELFSASQLNVMAGSGYWIVTQDANDGTIFSRHQLTCGDQSDVNQREQSVTTNLDHQSFTYFHRLKVYIGRGNVTETMMNILRGEVISIIQQFQNTVISDRLGPQVITATILELGAHPTFKDRVIIRIRNELPAPLNNVDLHLIVA